MPEKWNRRKSGRLARKAADILNDRGVAIRELIDSNGRMCIRGAINYAYSGNPEATPNNLYSTAPVVTLVGKTFKNRNTPIVKTVGDIGFFLAESLPESHPARGRNPITRSLSRTGISVEYFNDNYREEVIQWMYKFADDADPQKVSS